MYGAKRTFNWSVAAVSQGLENGPELPKLRGHHLAVAHDVEADILGGIQFQVPTIPTLNEDGYSPLRHQQI
jgi:hypothetical protein